MKTIINENEINRKYHSLLSANKEAERLLFFDIETTGFSPKSNMVYLIGLSFINEEKKLCSIQFLAEGIDDEKELLLAFLGRLSASSDMLLCGYNIKSFDIPFLNARLQKYELPSIALKWRDLFSDVKKLSNIFPMKGRRLRDVEAFLGIFREDDKSGGELIGVFFEYALHHEKENEEKLLYHNLSDTQNLFPLLVLDEFKKLFSPAISVEKVILNDNNSVSLSGSSGINVFSPFSIRTGDFLFTFKENRIKGTINFSHCKMKHYLPDPKSYVYLIEEEKIIPKALSASLEKDRFRKPLKEECYAEEEGDFFPVPDGFEEAASAHFGLLYKSSYKEKCCRIKKDRHAVTEEFLSSYAGMLIKSYLSVRPSDRRMRTSSQDQSPCNPPPAPYFR